MTVSVNSLFNPSQHFSSINNQLIDDADHEVSVPPQSEANTAEPGGSLLDCVKECLERFIGRSRQSLLSPLRETIATPTRLTALIPRSQKEAPRFKQYLLKEIHTDAELRETLDSLEAYSADETNQALESALVSLKLPMHHMTRTKNSFFKISDKGSFNIGTWDTENRALFVSYGRHETVTTGANWFKGGMRRVKSNVHAAMCYVQADNEAAWQQMLQWGPNIGQVFQAAEITFLSLPSSMDSSRQLADDQQAGEAEQALVIYR